MSPRRPTANLVGALALLAAMGAASARVLLTHLRYEEPGVDTLRICHWQLENGFRDALDRLIAEYEAHVLATSGRRVRVIQVPVTERGYQQYVNTGLIGGTAPDIIEQGKARTTEDPAYIIRFFLPLARYVAEPNPHNRGTRFEGVPWRDTFVDGMAGAYDRGLRDYYAVPFSMFTVRLFCNLDLLKRATGLDEPPATFQAFIDACRAIRAFAPDGAAPLVPIAGSRDQVSWFRNTYESAFLFPLIPRVDADLGGSVDPFEAYRGYVAGRWNFASAELQAAWRCMTEVTRHFQDGWVGAQRDDAVFMFAQQRAVMIASGSWDAQSIVSQAGGRFRVGVFDFPLPVDHPDYGRYVKGPPTEANIRGGIPWCVNARTRFPDLCIDFLRFCTTPERNARFNRSITWIPVLRGATLSDELKPFKPRIHGFYGHFNYYISPATRLIGEGNRWTLYAGGQSPADYGRELADIYERTAADGYREQLQRQRHHGRNLQRVLAALGASRLYADTRLDADLRTKAIQVLHSVQGNAGYVARNEGPFLALETRRRRSEDSR